jgi:hypothetical protein
MLSKSDWLAVGVAASLGALTFVVETPLLKYLCGIACAAVAVYAFVRFLRAQHEPRSGNAISWKEMEDRFKELEQLNLQHKGDGPLHAFQNEAGQESSWYVGGGGRKVTEDGQRLCALAGRKLKADGIAKQYLRLEKESIDLDRWLWFLVELGQASRTIIDGVTHGRREPTRYLYNIQFLTQSSVAGCVECLKHEMKPTL